MNTFTNSGLDELVDNSKSKFSFLLRLPQVKEMTGLSKSSIYQYEQEGRFPSRVGIGNRSVAWRQAEVAAWIESRKPVCRQDQPRCR